VSSSNRPSKAAAPGKVAGRKKATGRRPAASARKGPAPRPAVRVPAPATSRLTIKPGQSLAPRMQLQPSSKPRPAGPRRLSQVELDEDEVLIDAFDATLDGVRVRVTAVLERTCVYVDRDGDRRLARKTDLVVEADKLPIRRRSVV
jgi:hypothetical protein